MRAILLLFKRNIPRQVSINLWQLHRGRRRRGGKEAFCARRAQIYYTATGSLLSGGGALDKGWETHNLRKSISEFWPASKRKSQRKKKGKVASFSELVRLSKVHDAVACRES